MTVATMRALDRFIGIPLCIVTGIISSMGRGARRRSGLPEECTILVIKLFGLGSVLLSTPFLDSLRRSRPKSRIIYLTFEDNLDLLARLPQPDVRLAISTSSLRTFLISTYSALRNLRRERVRVVFDLEFFSKFSTFLSVLSGARIRTGFALPTFWRRSNLTHSVEIDRTAHVTEVFLSQLEQFGITSGQEIILTKVRASVLEKNVMEQTLGLGTNGYAVLCVNINAGVTSLERRWPKERFEKLLQLIIADQPATRIFLTGSSAERAYVQSLMDLPGLSGNLVNCAGLLSFGEFVALLERSSILITNDSGPMHLASSVGTTVVALFGPESPRLYGPLGKHAVLYANLACSPCLNMYNAKMFVCPYDQECMRSIEAEQVYQSIRSLCSDKVYH